MIASNDLRVDSSRLSSRFDPHSITPLNTRAAWSSDYSFALTTLEKYSRYSTVESLALFGVGETVNGITSLSRVTWLTSDTKLSSITGCSALSVESEASAYNSGDNGGLSRATARVTGLPCVVVDGGELHHTDDVDVDVSKGDALAALNLLPPC